MYPVEPLGVERDLRGLEGQWVAVTGQRLIEAARTLDTLLTRLRESQLADIRDAVVFRVPAENEAELIGLG